MRTIWVFCYFPHCRAQSVEKVTVERGFLFSNLGKGKRCLVEHVLAVLLLWWWMIRAVPRVPLTQRWWKWKAQGGWRGSDPLIHEGKGVLGVSPLEEGAKRRLMVKDEFPATCPTQGAAKVTHRPCASELHRNPQLWSNNTWRRTISSAGSSCGPASSFSENGVF